MNRFITMSVSDSVQYHETIGSIYEKSNKVYTGGEVGGTSFLVK